VISGVVVALLTGGVAAPATAASGLPVGHHHRGPTAVVSLGDSYISGEGGRWQGNSAASTPGRLGTDRAWRADPTNPAGVIDPSRVYGNTVTNGCHRSDVAPIVSARLLVWKSSNLACSGATTVNVLRASAGGVALKGEAPQDDQLAVVARADNVKLVVLSIGGNDLGFGGIVTSCVVAYIFATTPCSVSQQGVINTRLPQMAAAVTATVKDLRATMAAAGYRDRDYRLVIQSYPSPAPAAGAGRYSGTAPDARQSVGGCPFLDVDSAWARSTLVPAIASTLAGVARSEGAQFLDLTDAFHGHELCGAAAEQSTGRPHSATSEWMRFMDFGGQGDFSESLHPNYYGQQAMGHCLALAMLTRKDVACHALAKLPNWAVYLTRA
jgi:lysophospholipase L1-like esterase